MDFKVNEERIILGKKTTIIKCRNVYSLKVCWGYLPPAPFDIIKACDVVQNNKHECYPVVDTKEITCQKCKELETNVS